MERPTYRTVAPTVCFCNNDKTASCEGGSLVGARFPLDSPADLPAADGRRIIAGMKTTIYHNPRCTKSRQTLALLREHDVKPEIVEYLKTPPDKATIEKLLRQLGLKPADIIRKKEYRALGLAETDDEDELIARIASHPEILERPIVVRGNKARLGRPPENVLEIL
jgi:arsenate reductase